VQELPDIIVDGHEPLLTIEKSVGSSEIAILEIEILTEEDMLHMPLTGFVVPAQIVKLCWTELPILMVPKARVSGVTVNV
jgi:hypothetical protein